MSLFNLSEASPFGKGSFSPAGSIQNRELSELVANYKRTVASRYRALTPEEFDLMPSGKLYVSPKIDGQIWFLVVEGDECALVAPNGKVISGDLPVLAEARKVVMPRARGRLVLAGELFALRKGGRPRCGDVAAVLGGGADADTKLLGFHVFDLLSGGDAESDVPAAEYGDRLACFRRLCEGGKRLAAIKTEEVDSPVHAKSWFGEWAEGGKGEGIVVRAVRNGRIYKVKPIFSLDAAVIGFTRKAEDPELLRSVLLAVMRDDGRFQIIGSCGNFPGIDMRRKLLTQIEPLATTSSYAYASSSGALFQFVRPELVFQVKLTDVQAEDSSSKPIRRMVLSHDEAGWQAVAPMVGVSILHPVFERVRDDKEVNAVDVRASQLLERALVTDLNAEAVRVELPDSEILRRQVWTKTTKGKVAVRKLLLWKTHKELVDAAYPAFVVHWTDYSPGRKEPLKREVRLAPDLDAAEAIAEEMVTAGVKKGWAEVGA